jgi:hypothetical protein
MLKMSTHLQMKGKFNHLSKRILTPLTGRNIILYTSSSDFLNISTRNVYTAPDFNLKADTIKRSTDADIGNHLGRQQNHIWTKDEINDRLQNLYRHQPQSITDHIMNKLVMIIKICIRYMYLVMII